MLRDSLNEDGAEKNRVAVFRSDPVLLKFVSRGRTNGRNLDSSTKHGRTKKLDAESWICYDSDRKDSVFCGKAKAVGFMIYEERSRAPGNRTPLLIFYGKST